MKINLNKLLLVAICILLVVCSITMFRCKTLETNLENSNHKITQLENNEIDNYCNVAIQECELIEPIKEYDKMAYFELYKNIIDKYSDYIDAPESVYDYFTDEQINMICKCIETETFECDFDSKVNVACVILNRVEDDLYPTDPIEIIVGENQFAYGRNNITYETKLALEYAFMIEDTTNGCIGFRSDSCPSEWNGWSYQFTDNVGHNFYK